ncbi:MAG: helicase-exonuclease AddAB subunit AddA [Lachnospiraceae bacterium]|nr:helicase-exonuclease AddAB subunit AddA [Lachnospiraceae bacterium]
MSAITYSNDQLKIIESRDENLLVSAAAGSGKTAVLVERIIRRVLGKKDEEGNYIEPGIDIDKMLVVTFTNAAAREMKARIMQALEEKLSENPEDKHLSKQATLIHNAKIMTIDSFCLYLVKNHFNEIGIDPSFRIASEGEIKLLKSDLVMEVIKEAYESGNEDFLRVVDCYSSKENDSNLADVILELFSFAMSYPWPNKWIEDHRADYDIDSVEKLKASSMFSDICKSLLDDLYKILISIRVGRKICEDGPVEYLPSVEFDEENVVSCIEALEKDDIDAFLAKFLLDEKVTLARKASGLEDDKERFKTLRKKWQDDLKALKKKYFFVSLETAANDMGATSKIVNSVLDLLVNFMDKFNEAKRDRGIIDFVDMEHMAIQILIEDYKDVNDYKITGVAQSYRDYFEEVMVDEYQDANLVQEILLKSVSREDLDQKNNRFMVGDVKQSIYRFRLARPQIFMDKQDLYLSGDKKANKLITLKENYRNRKSVIDSVNAVFEVIMHKDMGGTGYDDDQRLYPKASYNFEDTSDNKTELILFTKEDNKSSIEMEAVAHQILSLKGKMYVNDKDAPDGKRLADFKDFAILFRSQGPNITTLCDMLEKYQIPYHLTGSGAFYSAREVREVLNFLRVLNNPLDDISLYGLMVSFFGGFTDEDMALICAKSEGEHFYLWDKVCEHGEKYKDERIISFISLIDDYRKRSVYTPISSLIMQILDETGYTLYVGALADGSQRLANVKMLVTKASEYAKTSFHGLFHFLRYIELMEKISVDEGEADISDENANTVRLMSIHKSKGLEFPICFVVSMGKAFNKNEMRENFVTDIDRGIGAQFVDSKLRIKRDTLRRKYILDKIEKESISEEIRVLYVAMTRAREKLIMTASVKDIDKFLEKLSIPTTDSFLGLVAPIAAGNPHLFDLKTFDSLSQEKESVESYMSLSQKRLEFETDEISEEEAEIAKRLKDRFSFEYPFKNLEKLYTKTTVSELKIAALEEQEGESHNPFPDPVRVAKVPVFAGGETEVSGTDRGTAFHKILSLLSFEKELFTKEALKDEIERLVLSGKVTKQEEEIVSFEKLFKFMSTDIAKRMHLAAIDGKLFKEQPFVIGLAASDVNAEFSSDETILVQGVIDVFFEEGDEIVVLDYKTDRVETQEELSNRYKTQLEYYAKALDMITGKSVKEKVLYSFGLNSTIVVK